MKRNLLWLLLVLSLLFNLFFAAGFLQARAQVASAEESDRVSNVLSAELALDDAQQDFYRQLRDGMRDEAAAYQGAIALKQRELMQELQQSDPDVDRVRELVASQTELHRQRRLAGGERFGEFLNVLSPDQCRRLSGMLSRHGPPREERERWLKERFDADKNGELDESERATLEAFLQERREDRHRRRQGMRARMLEQFDADGDGELNADEKAAMRAWRLSNPPRHRPGPPRHRPPPHEVEGDGGAPGV